LVFLVDESVGGKIVPEALRELGAEVHTVADRFGQGARDEDWLTEAGAQGWVVVTRGDLGFSANRSGGELGFG
jgi:hypothetical protein